MGLITGDFQEPGRDEEQVRKEALPVLSISALNSCLLLQPASALLLALKLVNLVWLYLIFFRSQFKN